MQVKSIDPLSCHLAPEIQDKSILTAGECQMVARLSLAFFLFLGQAHLLLL